MNLHTQFVDRFATLLTGYLRSRDEDTLARAYEIGREAMAAGLGVLELAAIEQEALRSALRSTGTGDLVAITQVQDVLIEALSPFEITHRTSAQANSTLCRFNETMESETRRIAQRLHGESYQLLAAIHLALAPLGQGASAQQSAALGQARALLGDLEHQLRQLSHELHPPMLDDLGIGAAIDFLTRSVADRSGLTIRVEGTSAPRCPPAVEIGAYRVVQEALHNVVKHAHADHVAVTIVADARNLICRVQDDGVGFDADGGLDPARRGIGLMGVRERLERLGGTLAIESVPGKGTTLHATIPLERSTWRSA